MLTRRYSGVSESNFSSSASLESSSSSDLWPIIRREGGTREGGRREGGGREGRMGEREGWREGGKTTCSSDI